jgi:hypothetical protein
MAALHRALGVFSIMSQLCLIHSLHGQSAGLRVVPEVYLGGFVAARSLGTLGVTTASL